MKNSRKTSDISLSRKPRYYWLDVARFFAIISISLNHAVNRSFDNYYNSMNEFFDIPQYLTAIKTIVSVTSRLGVPLFLMISGALLLRKKFDSKEDVQYFYKHNLLGILITGEIWYFIIYWGIVILDPEHGGVGSISEAIIGCIKNMLFIDQITFDSMWYIPMILCVYLVIPFISIAINKVSYKSLYLPLTILFLVSMIVPNINSFLSLLGSEEVLEIELSAANIFSKYFLYVVIGYIVSQAALTDINDGLLYSIVITSFAACCGYQFFAYSCPGNYLVSYDFAGIFLCSMFLFELLRRKADHLKLFSKPITYIARISFALYFVHIVIMQGIVELLSFNGWNPAVKMIVLELVSIICGICFIAVLSRISCLKRYLFLIKE